MSHESDNETATDSRLSTVADSSTVVRLVRGTKRKTEEVDGESKTDGRFERTRHIVRSSFLYRWLTAEPDPEVIVIDLRETYTVGPFVRLFERLGDELRAAMDESRAAAVGYATLDEFHNAPIRVTGIAVATVCSIALLGGIVFGALSLRRTVVLGVGVVVGIGGTRVGTSWEGLKQSRGGQLLVEAFSPPPLDEDTESESERDQTNEDETN